MQQSTPVEHNLKQVARRLGVHYATAYRYVRSGQLAAHREGTAWVVTEADLVAFERHDHNGPAPVAELGSSITRVERLADQLAVGDQSSARAVIDAALRSGWDAETVIVDLIAPAVHRVTPERGEAAVYLASMTAARLVTTVGSACRVRGRTRGSVVLGAPGHEAHTFGLAVIAEVIRMRNYDVLELGAGVPDAAFVDAARRAHRLVAVGVGVTGAAHLEAARTLVRSLTTAELGVPVYVGGQGAANPEVAALTGADGWAAGARDLADLISTRRPRRPPMTEAGSAGQPLSTDHEVDHLVGHRDHLADGGPLEQSSHLRLGAGR